MKTQDPVNNTKNNNTHSQSNSTGGTPPPFSENIELHEALKQIDGLGLMNKLLDEFEQHLGKSELTPDDIQKMFKGLDITNSEQLGKNIRLAFQNCITPEGEFREECINILRKQEYSEYLSGKTNRPSQKEASIFTLLLLMAELSQNRWGFLDRTARFVHFERVMGSYKKMLGDDPDQKLGFIGATFKSSTNPETGNDTQGSQWWKAYDDTFSTILSATGTAVATWIAQSQHGLGIPVASAASIGQLIGQFAGAPSRFLSSGQEIEVSRARMEKDMGDFMKQSLGDMKRNLEQRRDGQVQSAQRLADQEAQSKSTIAQNVV